MTGSLTVRFSPDQEFVVAAAEPLPAADAARQWLDEQFLEFDCEPLRASGKVLTADKLLAVADAAGARAFGPEGEGWLRWCFASRQPQRLLAGVDRLARALAL